jgi:transposase
MPYTRSATRRLPGGPVWPSKTSNPKSFSSPPGLPLVAWRHRLEEVGDGRRARKFDREFREGAVRIVRETGKPIAVVARELGINKGTSGNWVIRDRRARAGDGALTESERDELNRLRKRTPSWRWSAVC